MKALYWTYALTALLLMSPAAVRAQSDEETSDTDTRFEGAVMLKGNTDVFLESFGPGSIGSDNDEQYAYFVGDTLYAGVVDELGNATDVIGEFYWFESSEQRGSDFYVGVFKVRTTPALANGWRLETGSSPLLYLSANSDTSEGTGSFRWDWSLPMDNYGMDAYGAVKMGMSYGIGTDGEGSIVEADEGDGSSYTIQSKGFLDLNYRVATEYDVTLWRWEVLVQGAANHMDWSMFLNRGDRSNQNGYHEFYLVMQSDADVPFVLDNLEIGGAVMDPKWYWFDDHRTFSSVVNGITLQRPMSTIPEPNAPELLPDAAQTEVNVPVTVDILANDSIEGAADVFIAEAPQHGDAKLNADLTLTYVPETGYVGDDRIAYGVDNGAEAFANVALTVKAEPNYGGPSDGETVHNVGCALARPDAPLRPALLGLLLAVLGGLAVIRGNPRVRR